MDFYITFFHLYILKDVEKGYANSLSLVIQADVAEMEVILTPVITRAIGPPLLMGDEIYPLQTVVKALF